MKNPIQPIIDGRFKSNKIVEFVLENGNIDLNDIARSSFTNDDREQFAQLIGYSLSSYSSLSYVSDETYNAAKLMSKGASEDQARIESLTETIKEIKKGLKIAAIEAFRIHEDDLV